MINNIQDSLTPSVFAIIYGVQIAPSKCGGGNVLQDRAIALQQYLIKKHPGSFCFICSLSDLVNQKDADTNLRFLSLLDSSSKLYFLADGTIEQERLGVCSYESGKKILITFEQMADALRRNLILANLKKTDPITMVKKRLKISLLICGSGYGYSDHNDHASFLKSKAALFHQLLYSDPVQLDIVRADVIARYTILIFCTTNYIQYSKKQTIGLNAPLDDKTTTYYHKQPGSKLVFTVNENGQQIVKSGYQFEGNITYAVGTQIDPRPHQVTSNKSMMLQIVFKNFHLYLADRIKDSSDINMGRFESMVKFTHLINDDIFVNLNAAKKRVTTSMTLEIANQKNGYFGNSYKPFLGCMWMVGSAFYFHMSNAIQEINAL